MAKDRTYRRLIHSQRWLRLRRDTLSERPYCSRCQSEGRIRLATEVHHKRPVEDAYGDAEKERLMFDPHNLVPLCHDCHRLTHVEMGQRTKAATKERNRRQLDMLIKKFIQSDNENDTKGG